MWWLPIVAAALDLVRSDHDKRKAEQRSTDDTINSIYQRHAESIGADPSLGMATKNAINVGRADHDYQPPVNAVGAAIQAMGSESPKPAATPNIVQPLAADDPFTHNPDTYKDPWETGEGFY
jgi:hypothetical protein